MFGINISIEDGLYSTNGNVEIDISSTITDWRSVVGATDYLENRLGGAESLDVEDALVSLSSISEGETIKFLWEVQTQVKTAYSNYKRVSFT